MAEEAYSDEGLSQRAVRMIKDVLPDLGIITDIALDPFPYNGVTTTCEALWMGVPVVTWRGDRHQARIGASLLTRVGLANLVASDIIGYEKTVVALAGNPALLEKLRSNMRDRLQSSPLCDGAGFARDLEIVFRGIWQKWCGKQKDRVN